MTANPGTANEALPARVGFASAAAIACFSLVWFAGAVAWAWKTPLTTDEVFVVWVLRLFPFSGIAHAISAGADSLPPGYFYLLKLVCLGFGISPLVVRLPSIIAFYGFMAATWRVCRIEVSPSIATFAAALLCVTGAAVSAVLARPYAIVCACFALAILTWLGRSPAKEAEYRRAALLTLLFMAAVFVHFYAVLIPALLAVMEAVWLVRERRVRWAYWAAILVGAASVFMWWPVMGPIYRTTHASTSAPGFYARPTVSALVLKSIALFLSPGVCLVILFLGLVVLVCTLVRKSPRVAAPNGNASGEDYTIALIAISLFPLITFLFAALVTRSFNTRYFFAASMALSLAGARLLRRSNSARYVSSAGLILVCLLWAAHARAAIGHRDDRLELVRHTPDALPIVSGDASDFFELLERAPAPVRDRLVFVAMPLGQESPDPEPELVASKWKRLRPELAVVPAAHFFCEAQTFYLLKTPSRREGMTRWLEHHGGLALVSASGDSSLLQAEASRFERRCIDAGGRVRNVPAVSSARDVVDRPQKSTK